MDRRGPPRSRDRTPSRAHRPGRNCRARCRHARRNAPARACRPRAATSARSSGSVMPCSPPSASRWPISAACCSISVQARGNIAEREPQIADIREVKVAGSTQNSGCAPSVSMRLARRMACGPSRAPARLVVPISSGTPATTKSASRSLRVTPRKPGGIANVGVSVMRCVLGRCTTARSRCGTATDRRHRCPRGTGRRGPLAASSRCRPRPFGPDMAP